MNKRLITYRYYSIIILISFLSLSNCYSLIYLPIWYFFIVSIVSYLIKSLLILFLFYLIINKQINFQTSFKNYCQNWIMLIVATLIIFYPAVVGDFIFIDCINRISLNLSGETIFIESIINFVFSLIKLFFSSLIVISFLFTTSIAFFSSMHFKKSFWSVLNLSITKDIKKNFFYLSISSLIYAVYHRLKFTVFLQHINVTPDGKLIFSPTASNSILLLYSIILMLNLCIFYYYFIPRFNVIIMKILHTEST